MIVTLGILLDVTDGPGLKSAPPKPFVISRHNRGKSKNEHVGKGVFLTRIGLGFGTPTKSSIMIARTR